MMIINSLQELPFYNLDNREFHLLNGTSHLQLENLKDIDIYNMISNPDKADKADPDNMFINPQSNYYDIPSLNKVLYRLGTKPISLLHCNIRSLTKNLNVLEDVMFPTSKS